MPGAMLFTSPVLLIVATVVLLLVQVPPVAGSARVLVWPAHSRWLPDMGPGSGLVLMVVVIEQPVYNVYVIVPVPGAKAVTVPLPPP
jgi:hypothetical protein